METPIPEKKYVLALQAFVTDEQSQLIIALCRKAGEVAEANYAFASGAVPHVTISAWSVTGSELVKALGHFNRLDLQSIEPLSFTGELGVWGDESSPRVGFYLQPSESSRAKIDAFRQQILNALGYAYEDFQGRSNAEWDPHLTLFGVKSENREDVQAILSELEAISSIQLSALALVGFEEGIQTLAVRELE